MKASAKLIQSLSTGIYRTPANALKELISNAFDADARHVRIGTDYPRFRTVTVFDDGQGIDPEGFIFSMEHIGGSLKRVGGDKTTLGRPIIGRIGIGLLAVGQACREFKITSARAGEAFGVAAEISLAPFFSQGAEVQDLGQLTIGNVTVREYSKETKDHYTLVTLEDILPAFRQRLMPTASEKRGRHFEMHPKKSSESYADFINWIPRTPVSRIEQLSGYNQFLWELGLMTPVPYLKDGPIRDFETKGIRSLKKRLAEFGFHVYVDNVEIFKPILLPNDPDVAKPHSDFDVYDFSIEGELQDGRRVQASGYYYHQVRRIKPAELRGLLPRVLNVGVGGFDSGFFRQIRESPIIAYQLCGELYLDEGLDQALNIDRNSFFETDDAYRFVAQELQRLVKPEIREGETSKEPAETIPVVASKSEASEPGPILSSIRRRQDEHVERSRKKRQERAVQSLKEIAREFGFSDYSVRVDREERPRTLIGLDSRRKAIVVHLPTTLSGSVAVRVRTLEILTLVGLTLNQVETLEEFEKALLQRLSIVLRN